jgi:hypothetical protein
MSGPTEDFCTQIAILSNDTTALYLSFIPPMANELFFMNDVKNFNLALK